MERVHIGSGFWNLRGGRALRAVARSNGRPVIPGSSMKGLIRARYEAITKSCVGHEPPKRKVTLDDQLPSRSHPYHQVVLSDAVVRHDVFAQCKPPMLCAACALFGRMSQRGRISVHDLLAPEGAALVDVELPKRFSPRPHHLGHYTVRGETATLVVNELRGRKFHVGDAPPSTVEPEYVEAIEPGTILTGRIICTNVTEAEVGGLLCASGISPASSLKIGSAKAYRFGRLEVAGVGRLDVVKRPKGFQENGFVERIRESFTRAKDYWKDGEAALLGMHGGAT
ncbi:RAMP superfamily CRISPR-associated protein [Paraliomyxa miuraensis]|nr:RAMP superfamily CRISPR-associated protein [Paraliomyxa miuraensis]